MKLSLVAVFLPILFSACVMPAGMDPFADNPYGIPNEKMPPPGLCRIWYPNRPSRNQPPIGDCDYLQARLPSDAQLIRGDGRASMGQANSTAPTYGAPVGVGNGLPPANNSVSPSGVNGNGSGQMNGSNDQFGIPDPQADMQKRRQEDLNRRY